VFRHDKTLMVPVRVDEPNPRYAAMVLEQFGGANGELKACLQYMIQSFGVQDLVIRDLLLDISTEEISHLELVGTLISKLLAPVHRATADGSLDPRLGRAADMWRNADSTVQKMLVVGGGGPLLTDSAGVPFSGDFINSTGDLAADIASDIAAELRAKSVYENLYREVHDRGARELFDFLIQREETHSTLFIEARERTRDLGVTRDARDTPFSHRYPALSTPSVGHDVFETTRGRRPIHGPLEEDEVRVNLARMPGR